MTGEGSAWAIRFLKKINSYSEPSYTGTGYRFFCTGKLPEGINKVAGCGDDDLSDETKARIIAVKPPVAEKLAKWGPSETWNQFEIYEDGPRPDALTEWSTRDWTEEVGKEYAAKMMDVEYEMAVTRQKKELREYTKKAKSQAQLPQVEPVPLTIEEDLSRGDRPEPIKA